MKTTYTVKNFRVFDENGATIDFAPITILTGRNSAGKSSIVKSLALLDSFLQQVKKDEERNIRINLDQYRLDFSKGALSKMGGFNKILRRDAANKEITFEYTAHSNLLSKDLVVSLVFTANDLDEQHCGYLKSIVVKTTEEDVVYTSNANDGSFVNGNQFRSEFIKYVELENHIRYATENIMYEGARPKVEKHIAAIKQYGQSVFLDSIKSFAKNGGRFVDASKYEVLQWSIENNSLFRMPVVEQLSRLQKTEVKEAGLKLYEAQLAQSDPEYDYWRQIKKDRDILNRMFDDFAGSECKTLQEYLTKKEIEFLSRININNRGSFHHRVSPKIPYQSDMALINIYQFYRETNDDSNLTFDYCHLACELMEGYNTSEQYLYNAFCNYVSSVIREALLPEWVGAIVNVGTSNVSAKRFYILDDENDKMSHLINSYLIEQGKLQRKQYQIRRFVQSTGGDPDTSTFCKPRYNVGDFTNKWIKRLGFGNKISIKHSDEFGVNVIRLHKTDDDEGTIIADEGLGLTQFIYLLLEIEKQILIAMTSDLFVTSDWNIFSLLRNMQYDDSIIEETLKKMPITITVEEPEVHLHPQFQSMLADLFVDAMKYGIHFIVETHSEYLIRRSQVIVSQSGYNSNEECEKLCPFRTFYCPQDDSPYSLGYRKDGKFVNDFGPGFFDEASDLLLQIL